MRFVEPRVNHRAGASAAGFRVLVFCLSSVVCAAAAGQDVEPVHTFGAEPGSPYAELLEDENGNLFGTYATEEGYGPGGIFELVPDGSGGFAYHVVHAFTADGGSPRSGLVDGTDGYFYGTTSGGGAHGVGTVYRANAAGFFEVLHSFDISDGWQPVGTLVRGPGAWFYGATRFGGPALYGVIFRIDAAGNFEVVRELDGGLDGRYPETGLTLGPDGNVYGTTSVQGAIGGGTIFRVDSQGAFTTVHAFGGFGQGVAPRAALTLASDGLLYGTTIGVSDSSLGGTVFRFDPAVGLEQLHVFAEDEGRWPFSALLDAGDGYLYGTLLDRGLGGSIFRIDGAGTVETLHVFAGTDGAFPFGGLIKAGDGRLYGATTGGLAGAGNIFRMDPAGTSFEVIHTFVSAEGRVPVGNLIRAADGRICGTTALGGTGNGGTAYCFEPLSTDVEVLHPFSVLDATLSPNGIVQGGDGAFYGTTAGLTLALPGAVFRIGEAGAFSLFHSFAQDPASGTGLTLANDGSLLGAMTRFYGGSQGSDVFHLDSLGNYDVLHTLTINQSANPVGNALVQTNDGSLFVSAGWGLDHPDGSLFRRDPDGTFSLIHSFDGPEGRWPQGLTLAPDGLLYGMTRQGGASYAGTVFRIDRDGRFQLLHTFDGVDGLEPIGSLTQASDGNLYGATSQGGAQGGVILRVDSSGVVTVVGSVVNAHYTVTNLVEGLDGALYGATNQGGANRTGVLYRFTPPPALSVWTVSPRSGPASGGTLSMVSGFHFADMASATVGGAPAGSLFVDEHTLQVTTPPLPAGTLNAVAVTNPGSVTGSLAKAWFSDFLDVAQADIFHTAVESVFRSGVTAGCGAGLYCRDGSVTRAQMAVFLLKAKLGSGYAPPAATGLVFADVPADSFAAAWIEDLAARQIAAGCGGGNFCPGTAVTRAQMAVFLLKALLGAGYAPPAASGTVFEDVQAGDFAAGFIEDLAARSITGGCSVLPALYCPTSSSTRGQMAVFVVKTFGLP